jgi:hypothetical protein
VSVVRPKQTKENGRHERVMVSKEASIIRIVFLSLKASSNRIDYWKKYRSMFVRRVEKYVIAVGQRAIA